MRTHYQNLKIAENAPDEVVKAAYRALSQTWHPDRNPDNPDAVRVMQILNSAYEVLFDPERRRNYDRSLAEMRSGMRTTPQMAGPQASPPPKPQASPPPKPQTSPPPKPQTSPPVWQLIFTRPINFLLVKPFHWLVEMLLLLAIQPKLIAAMAIFGVVALVKHWNGGEKTPTPGRHYKPGQHYSATPPASAWKNQSDRPVNESSSSGSSPPSSGLGDRVNQGQFKPAYVRPVTAPNGEAWPTKAAYIPGFPSLAHGGLSSVTVDNTQNSSDVFLKLVCLNEQPNFPVRVCFIPKGSSFTFKDVLRGSYDVRYRSLNRGGLARTEAFALQETKTADGTNYSNISLTLYTVTNGNMHTEEIDESEF